MKTRQIDVTYSLRGIVKTVSYSSITAVQAVRRLMDTLDIRDKQFFKLLKLNLKHGGL